MNELMALHAKTQLADSESGLNAISVKRFYSYLSEHSGYDYGAAPCMLLAVNAHTGRVTTAGHVLLATGAWHGPTATHPYTPCSWCPRRAQFPHHGCAEAAGPGVLGVWQDHRATRDRRRVTGH